MVVFFTDAQIKLSYRAYALGTAPGAFQDLANGGAFALPSDAASGEWVVDVIARDGCGSAAYSQPFNVPFA